MDKKSLIGFALIIIAGVLMYYSNGNYSFLFGVLGGFGIVLAVVGIFKLKP